MVRRIALTAQELVTELVAFAGDWKGSRSQDDITFVVVRMKERAGPM